MLCGRVRRVRVCRARTRKMTQGSLAQRGSGRLP